MFIEPLDSLLCRVRETLNLLAEVLELLGSRLEVGNLGGEGGRGGVGREEWCSVCFHCHAMQLDIHSARVSH